MTKGFTTLKKHSELEIPSTNKTKFFYYINKLTGVYYLCIPLYVIPDILAIAYREGYPGFAQYYEIISCSWFMRGLTIFFCLIIRHCSQCLALQTKCYLSYKSLQLIDSSLVFFFTLILDFVLALPASKKNTMRWCLLRINSQNE